MFLDVCRAMRQKGVTAQGGISAGSGEKGRHEIILLSISPSTQRRREKQARSKKKKRRAHVTLSRTCVVFAIETERPGLIPTSNARHF